MGNMKANRKFVEGEEAVSAVIGVILMVAITVAIAATVYVYVSGMIGGTATKTSSISMNTFSKDDAENKVIWLVAGLEGDAVSDTSYTASVLDADTGSPQNVYLDGVGTGACGAWVNFSDSDGDGYVNPGDTFSVTINATTSGYYVFMLTDTATGSTLYKSATTKY